MCRGCWNVWYPQSTLELGIAPTGPCEYRLETEKVEKCVGNMVGNTHNLLKIQEEEGRAGRKDLGNTEQVR